MPMYWGTHGYVSENELLFFIEDGNSRSRIHIRDRHGRNFTTLEEGLNDVTDEATVEFVLGVDCLVTSAASSFSSRPL